MSNLLAILKSAEESVQTIEDHDLRKIAFQEVLRYQLSSEEAFPHKKQERPVVGTSSRRAAGRSSPALKANSQAGIRREVVALDLSPDEHGLVPWANLSADWTKFCWILEAAHLKKVEELTNAEISYLIDKTFRESKSAEVVNNLKVQTKKGMVKPVTITSGDREYRGWKILAGGAKEVTAKAGAAE